MGENTLKILEGQEFRGLGLSLLGSAASENFY